jgi:predicted permease
VSFVPDLVERFRALVWRGREERDLADEIAFHLEMEAEQHVRHGVSPVEARRRARLALGGAERIKEEVRDARGTRLVEDLRQDVRYAARTLGRNRVFAASVLIILALGIGANAATFTVIRALLLRPLPVPHPERLVTIGDPARTGSVHQGTPAADLASYPVFEDIRAQNHVLSGLYASGRTGRLDVSLPAGEGAASSGREHPRGRLVSGDYFAVLGVVAQLGRTFSAAEDVAPGADPVVVISDAYWRRRFGSDRAVPGRTITINETPFTIVGVAPAGFSGTIVGQPTDIWIPLMMQPAIMPHREWLDDRGVSWLLLMGRLAPGVALPQARAALVPIVERSLLDHADASEVGGVREGLRQTPVSVDAGTRGFSYYRRSYTPSLLTLTAAVGLVLLIVCANVGNLLLARAEGRRREMGMRLALGAGRGRLVRQLLTESTILAAAGGALGLLGARWGSRALLVLGSNGPGPIPLDVSLDAQVLGLTLAMTLGTALLFGLLPAVRTSGLDLTAALRSGGRGAQATGRRPRTTLGRTLVAVQFALSLLLLVGTAMLLRSARRMHQAELGLDREHLVVARVDARRSGYEGARFATLVRELTARLAAIPGVRAVSVSENGLFSGSESGTTLAVEGFTARAASDTEVAYDDVGPGYFHTIGGRILLGRDFTDGDRADAPHVAIVNQTMARFFFPNASPIGRRLKMEGSWYEIVGLVADVEEQSVRAGATRRLYLPMAQMAREPGSIYLEARATEVAAGVVQPIRQVAERYDPGLVVLSVNPLTDLIRDSQSQDQLVSTVVTVFGAVALLLAALGLYGVMAYATSRRTPEFGVRMALGARPGDVTRLVLQEALAITTVGVILGLPAAFATSRLLRHQIFGIGTFDPPSLLAGIAALSVSAALAGYLPARRAAHVSPVEALRGE